MVDALYGAPERRLTREGTIDIAAGLGIAALLSHFGLSEGLGSLLLIGLVIFAGVFLVRMFMSRRETAKPLQYAGAVGRDGARRARQPVHLGRVVELVEHVARAAGLGKDAEASARIASEAKRQFIRLQGSYDTADRAALSAVMTSEMYTEIARELDERGPHQATEIVKLDADVLDASTEGDTHWASVRFTGLVREDGEPLPKSIDEVWNLAKPVRGTSGWLLAGIRQIA